MDQCGIDTILVGDSLGMTMQGYADTIPVTMEEMIVYGRSVCRACENAFVVLDMPFMSYQVSVEQAVANAGRLMKECGANAVKLEGGKEVCDQIRAITASGIPVCAHVGLTPQAHNCLGGFKVQGKGEAEARRVLEDALAVEAAGRLYGGAGMCAPQTGRPDYRENLHDYHWHRRRQRLRRPGAGVAGHDGHERLEAQVCPDLWPGGPGLSGGLPGLQSGGEGRVLPQRRGVLCEERLLRRIPVPAVWRKPRRPVSDRIRTHKRMLFFIM